MPRSCRVYKFNSKLSPLVQKTYHGEDILNNLNLYFKIHRMDDNFGFSKFFFGQNSKLGISFNLCVHKTSAYLEGAILCLFRMGDDNAYRMNILNFSTPELAKLCIEKFLNSKD